MANPGRTITFQTGERKGQTINLDDAPKRQPQAPGGEDPATGKVESVDEAVDRMSSDVPTNAGKQAQSTDHMNQY
jgi:hypothetical protein